MHGEEQPLVGVPETASKQERNLTMQYPVKKLPRFPEERLHEGNELPIDFQKLLDLYLHLPVSDGPCVVGPFKREKVAGIDIGSESYLIWLEGSHIASWMPVSELPHGGTRRGDWLLWSDGRVMERIQLRPETPDAVKAETPKLSERDLERRAEAGAELNRDLEHFVAMGASIEKARHLVKKVHVDVLATMVQQTFFIFQMWAGLSGLADLLESAESFGQLAKRVADKSPNASPSDHRLANLIKDVPQLAELAPTKKNIEGLRSLAEVIYDARLPEQARAEFLAAVKDRLGGEVMAVEKLFDLVHELAQTQPQKFLRQGPKIQSVNYIKNSLGGLKRVISLEICASMVTREFYAKAADASNGLLPTTFEKFKSKNLKVLADVVRSGKVAFDPNTDLRADALVTGKKPGSSGWFFAAADAATSSPDVLQEQLAVGPEYARGYVVLELSPEVAVAHGVSRPTALDLTVSSQGKVNPNFAEQVGRTSPEKAAHRSVREVILPPLPLSLMSSRTFVRGQ